MRRGWLVLMGLALGSTPAHAILRTYPGGAPCNTTLQACITGAGASDTISITTNAVIDESLSITKSLTVEAASGVTVTIGAGAVHRTVSIGDGGGGSVTIAVRNIHFEDTAFTVTLDQGSSHNVTIEGCDIDNAAGNGISLNVDVPSTVTVRDNFIRTPSDGIDLRPDLASGTATIVLERNRITTGEIFNSGDGISLQLSGAGTSNVRIASNVIYGVTGCNCGGATGIYVRAASGTATAVVDVVNNTVDNMLVASDCYRVAAPSATNQITVNFFNNIATRASQAGFSIDDSVPQLTVTGGFNASYDNADEDSFGGYSLGTMLAVDPRYENAPGGDYRLRDESPLINAGTASPPGGIGTLDAGDGPRLVGPAPDLGAYESPAGSSTTTTTVAGGTTTTTTLPPGGCATGATYESVLCRIAALRTTCEDQVDAALGGRLGALLTKARASARLAQGLDAKKRKRALTKASKTLGRFEKAAGSVPPPLRDQLRAGSDAIQADLATLAAG